MASLELTVAWGQQGVVSQLDEALGRTSRRKRQGKFVRAKSCDLIGTGAEGDGILGRYEAVLEKRRGGCSGPSIDRPIWDPQMAPWYSRSIWSGRTALETFRGFVDGATIE